MLKTFNTAFRVPEVRKKVLFTIMILVLYRLGNYIPVPFIDTSLLQTFFASMENTVLGLINVMSGGAFSMATLFALSVQPFINASIIIQLLTVAIPFLEHLAREEGEKGRKRMEWITRIIAVMIALIMSLGYYIMLRNNGILTYAAAKSFWASMLVIGTFVAGAILVMFMGTMIDKHGIGNGISLILFTGIISRLPYCISVSTLNLQNGSLLWWNVVLALLVVGLLLFMIVLADKVEYRIPVQYAQRVVGRKTYGGNSSHIPVKMTMASVMPVIFAQSIVSMPATIGMLMQKDVPWFRANSPQYILVFMFLVWAFSFFYVAITYDPVEIANNLKRNGGFIPGYRPGKPTSDLIRKVFRKYTAYGAIYLMIVTLIPMLTSLLTSVPAKMGVAVGGTTLIIVVGVAVETYKALRSEIEMRYHKGFLS